MWPLADMACDEMGKLLDAANLGESDAKRCCLDIRLIYLGVLFNSQELTLTIENAGVTHIAESVVR